VAVLASYRPECPICLCRDACAFGAAERAGNALYSARVYLELGRRRSGTLPVTEQTVPVEIEMILEVE
jgi:hypothetical protein